MKASSRSCTETPRAGMIGERAREAVETLIRASAAAGHAVDKPGAAQGSRHDLYIAAVRLILRCVVVLFAEARGMLPRSKPVDEQSNGLQCLRASLDRIAAGSAADRLHKAHDAWPRVLSVFRLFHPGLSRGPLPASRDAGGLFTPGESGSEDPILRALAAFEAPDHAPADAAVHRILNLLCRTRMKVRRGNTRHWTEADIDFSALSAEHIGIFYEGLLDFELRRAPAAKPSALFRPNAQPGEWLLARCGAARKGSGTFYTIPRLAEPTVRRALQPLAYDAVSPTKDDTAGLATADEWVPKKPEEILALKVCDPAMGSGSFLVAALRYLTEALFESVQHHEPLKHPECADRLKAKLKRNIAERCLYGVDLDPLAVELARAALWIETMDGRLPLGFVDSKLKCGNSLIGCWFDRFQDYPVMAWAREGGDKEHVRFVHHYREVVNKKGETRRAGDKWTTAIKNKREEHIKPELQRWLTERFGAQSPSGASGEAEPGQGIDRDERPADCTAAPLKEAFDMWCALWFWPGDELEKAPGPRQWPKAEDAAREVARQVARELRFFHWELGFPDVFTGADAGFDAVVGNPPWEIHKPSSMEFFSKIDPCYRSYGKQEALAKQRALYEADAQVEKAWMAYSARFKALSNWTKHVAHPFGSHDDPRGGLGLERRSANATLFDRWRAIRERRRTYADRQHPFRYQGPADLNSYKLMSEVAHAILKKGGRLGIVVPAGIYTDMGATGLRRVFLERSVWEWLFSFENKERIFDIHRSFKFCSIILRKHGVTEAVRAAFMHRTLDDWEDAEKHVLSYPRKRIEQFSPRSRMIVEVRFRKDVEVLQKMYAGAVLLGACDQDGRRIRYTREFDMTTDSRLFPPVAWWRAKGYRPDEYGHWILGRWMPLAQRQSMLERDGDTVLSSDGTECIRVEHIEDVGLPLYEGRMIDQFDFSRKGWVSGRGRTARWRDISLFPKVVEPQFVLRLRDYPQACKRYGHPTAHCSVKVAFMDVTSATNERTMIACPIADLPCGNSLPVLTTAPERAAALAGVLNSFVYDFVARGRCGGLHLNYFVIEESPLPRMDTPRQLQALGRLVWRTAGIAPRFARAWLMHFPDAVAGWRRLWAITPRERLRLRSILDAVVAELYGLDIDDFAWILRDCDHPVAKACDKPFSRTLDPKGFWRVDKDKDPELRHSILSQVAFHELKRMGLDAFLALNDGDGWMLPETLRLADYGLGHDGHARQAQPVAERVGERFLPWQLELGAKESWEQCRRHAERMDKVLGLKHTAG